jgi:hypothetical protein
MAKSLFQRNAPELRPPTNFELIEPEVIHLKKGYSIRYGPKQPKRSVWLVLLGFCGLAYIYLMDPILHAWYKGEAVKTYLYLHNYGNAQAAQDLINSQILDYGDIQTLNHRTGAFQDDFKSLQDATAESEKIITYMNSVRLLHAGRYQALDPLGRMRYLLFIRTGLVLPTQWGFLDPSVGN